MASLTEFEMAAYRRDEAIAFVEQVQNELQECRHLGDRKSFDEVVALAYSACGRYGFGEPYRSQLQAMANKALREVW